ncbi:MAG TPA: hypothetical protein VKZ41_12135 [Gemmatimonadales bacterium]|nr:hypothetical protein [Gemmatimonadales bacterium]
MSSKRVEALLYESAAVLRRVDRELEAFREFALSEPATENAWLRADTAAPAQDDVAHYDRSDLLAGLDRVSRQLNEMHPASANLPAQSM